MIINIITTTDYTLIKTIVTVRMIAVIIIIITVTITDR